MDPLVLRVATSQRFKSLKNKLALLLVLAAACYGLYRLDNSKRAFEEDKAKPILIDSELKSKIEGWVDDKEVWKNINDLILIRQQTTNDDFVNRVVERIRRSSETEIQVARTELNSCVNKVLTPPADNEIAVVPRNNKKHPRHHIASSPVGPVLTTSTTETTADCLDKFENRQRTIDNKAQDQIATVYTYFSPLDLGKLERGETQPPPPRSGQTNNQAPKIPRVNSFLDEQSGLHILYQILRIAILVIIVFALITVVGLLLSAVMLSDGLKTFSEQATSLIDTGKRSGISSARAAAVSVAALGLGTAVGAGVSTPSAAETAYAGVNVRDVRGTSTKQPGSRNHGGDLIAHRDATNNKYDFSTGDSNYAGSTSNFGDVFGDDNSVRNNFQPPRFPVKVYPKIYSSIYPDVIVKTVPPGELKLDPTLEKSIADFITASAEAHKDLGTRIDNKNISNVSVSNPPKDAQKNAGDKPLLIDFVDSNNLIREPLDLLKRQIALNTDLKLSLEQWQKNQTTLPSQPNRRSTLGRIFKGPDRYFVSATAAQQIRQTILTYYRRLEEIGTLQTDPSLTTKKIDSRITDLIDLLYANGGKPETEKVFWQKCKDWLAKLSKITSELRADREAKLKNLPDETAKKDLAEVINQMPETSLDFQLVLNERLEFWRETILTYARIR